MKNEVKPPKSEQGDSENRTQTSKDALAWIGRHLVLPKSETGHPVPMDR